MPSDKERTPVMEIARRLRGLERALQRTLQITNSPEEHAHLSQRRGIYEGIADDIDRDYKIDSKAPPLTNAEVGMGRLAGSAKFDQIRCYDEHSAKRMLAAAPGMECRLCPKPSVMFIAIPNEWGFNVLPGYCKAHGTSMLLPYEGSSTMSQPVLERCGVRGKLKTDCICRPKTGFDKFFDEEMKDPKFAAGYAKAREDIEAEQARLREGRLSPAEREELSKEVPRYYEAIGPNKDDPETKRLEGVINNIVHDVLTEDKKEKM